MQDTVLQNMIHLEHDGNGVPSLRVQDGAEDAVLGRVRHGRAKTGIRVRPVHRLAEVARQARSARMRIDLRTHAP